MRSVFHYLYNKSVKSAWLIGCIGLGIMPIVVGCFVYLMNISSFHRQTVRNNEAMLMQMYDLADKAFNDVSNIAYEVTADNYLNEYIVSKGTSKEMTVKRQIQKWLAMRRNGSMYISEVGVYFPETDELVTDSTVAPLDIIYVQEFQDTFENCESLRSRLAAVETQDLVLAGDLRGTPSLIYLRKGIAKGPDMPVVLIRLDSTILNNMIDNVEDYTSCEMNFLLNNSGQYFYAPSGIMQDFAVENREFKPVSKLMRSTFSGKDVISYISFNYLDLTMVLCTPWRMFGYEITKVNAYFLAGFLILLLGSTGLTFFFIKTNYRPVRELLNLALDTGYLSSLDHKKSTFNEYDMLREVISSSKNETSNMKELMEEQEKELKQSILALLMQNSKQVLGKRQYLELLKDSFPFEFFGVVALGETGNDVCLEEGSVKKELDGSLEAYAKEIRCFCLLKDTRHIVLLFNLLQKNNWEGKVREIVKNLAAGFFGEAERQDNNVVYGISSLHRGIGNISEAYQEADYALRYQLIFGESPKNEWEKLTDSYSLTKSFYYSEDDEKRLSNAITDGQAGQAGRIFDEIWRRNTVENNIPSEYIYFLLYDISSTVIRTGNLVSLEEDISGYILEKTREMVREQSVDKLRNEIAILIHEVSCAYEKEHSRSSDRLRQKILDYIEKNYSNPDLSVEAISEVFGRSRTSLFLLFKDGTGNSLLYLINKVRIRHAQEMLICTEKTVNAIAMETGFASAVNFARVFKKYTQLTPGKYRERYAGKENEK